MSIAAKTGERLARRILILLSTSPRPSAAMQVLWPFMERCGVDRATILHLVPRSGTQAEGSIELDQLKRAAPDGADVRAVPVSRTEDPVEVALRQIEEEGAVVLASLEAGMFTQKLLRRAPCSLLVLGQDADPRASGPILAPVDFSPASDAGARFALALGERIDRPVELFHVYSVPTGFHKIGRTYEEFASTMEGHARRAMDQLLRRLEPIRTKVETRFELANHPAPAILAAGRSRPYSQMVLGSRRRTAAAGFLLANVTERVALSAGCPVWAIRDDSSPVGFWEALLSV